jgi:uncharacterized protein YkwD
MMNSILLASVLVAATPQVPAHPLANVDPVGEETSPYPGRRARLSGGALAHVDPVDDEGGIHSGPRSRIPGGALANVTPVDGVADLDDDDAPEPVVVRRPVAARRVWVKETRCFTVVRGGRTQTTCKVVRSGWRDAPPPAAPARPARPATAEPDDDVEVPPPAPGAPEAPPARAPAAAAPAAGLSTLERAVVGLLNQARRGVGLPALAADAALARVARAHSQDMCSRRYFSHRSPEGKSPWDRLRKGGVKFRAAAENIASGQATAAAVHASWMRSAGHFANRMNRDYTRVGVGVVDCGGQLYWTEVFTR